MTSQERINQRFAKDFNLPINIYREDIFEYYHNLYKDFWPEEEWISFKEELKEYPSLESWLAHYKQKRDEIMNYIDNLKEYQEFNSCDMSKYGIDSKYRNIPDSNIYNESSIGKTFLSIDLKKANFQALKYVGVIKEDTYEDFIDKFDKSFYFKKSKYSRQVIFGHFNPKRQITVEHYMMSQIIPLFEQYDWMKLVAFKSDELIYEVDEDKMREQPGNLTCATIVDTVSVKLNFFVSVECFKIDKLPVVNSNGNQIDAYVKTNLDTGAGKLKSTSAIYFPQIYKLWKGISIEDTDLLFYYEDQIAKFIKPLELKKENI